MKGFIKIKSVYLTIAVLFTISLTATAQQLKPKEIIYSRLQPNLQAAPTGANSPTIWACGQDGANDRQITTGMQPRISDDGRFLLFKRFTGTPNNAWGNPWGADGQLWVRDLANGTETMIFSWGNTYQLGYYFSPFSNQGNYEIVFAYGSLLYIMNRDGTNAVPLEYYFGGGSPREGDNFPVLRRDDSRLAADSRDGGIVTRTLGSDLPANVPNTLVGDYNPSWSNDNQFIGYGTLLPSNANPFNWNYPYPFLKLSKIRLDGTGKVQLGDLTGTGNNQDGIAFGTIWTDDNSKIIAAARINGVAGLYAFNTDGSGTYTRIPISAGNAPDWVGGIVQPRVEERLISSAGGVVSDQFGNRVQLVSQYSMDVSIGEPIVGDVSGGSFNMRGGFLTNVPAAGGGGMEGDVAARPNGDGVIQSNDVVQVQRFQIGLDIPSQSNEFQRADSAPFSSNGDGLIQSNDVVQSQRYQIGLDQPQTAAGPTEFDGSAGSQTLSPEENVSENKPDNLQYRFKKRSLAPTAPRELHVEDISASAGQQVTVNILVDALGDESAYGFTAGYNQAILTSPSVMIGNAGGSRLCNTATAGQINCSINNFPDDLAGSSTDQIGEIHAGNNQILVKINFTVSMNAAPGTTSVTLLNVNASNDAAVNLPISSQDGTVTITGPTAAEVTVSGRVLTAGGRGIFNAIITMTDSRGTVRKAISTAFGYFYFDNVPSGETYIFTITAKRFTFSQPTQVLFVANDNENIVFIADQ